MPESSTCCLKLFEDHFNEKMLMLNRTLAILHHFVAAPKVARLDAPEEKVENAIIQFPYWERTQARPRRTFRPRILCNILVKTPPDHQKPRRRHAAARLKNDRLP